MLFRHVGVGNQAIFKPGGAARNSGDGRCNPTACAGLCCGHPPFAGSQNLSQINSQPHQRLSICHAHSPRKVSEKYASPSSRTSNLLIYQTPAESVSAICKQLSTNVNLVPFSGS